MKAYHLFMIRHGMTEGNRKGQYIGKTDLPLSGEGIRQLTDMMAENAYPQAEAFYCSPLQRCVQTMHILYPDAHPVLVPELAECDFGEYEGKTFEELENDADYKKWVSNAGSTAPPGGESGVDFQVRCCKGFVRIVEGLLRTGRQNAVIVAHGGTITSILSTLAFPRRTFYEWMTANGTGYEVVVHPQLWMSGKVVEVTDVVPFRPYEQEAPEEPSSENPEEEENRRD